MTYGIGLEVTALLSIGSILTVVREVEHDWRSYFYKCCINSVRFNPNF